MQSNSLAQVSVADDGVGIAAGDGRSDGMGIRTMHHRARIIGGSLTVRRREPRGTVVECSAPVS